MSRGDYVLTAVVAVFVVVLVWLVLDKQHPGRASVSQVPPAAPTVAPAVPHGSWQ